MSDPQSDLDVSIEDHFDFVREISTVFRESDATWLLRLVGFPPRDVPDFRPGEHIADWKTAFQLIDSGTLVTPTPHRDLLHQALRFRPGNKVFLRIQQADAASTTTTATPQADPAPPAVRRVHVMWASPRDRDRLRGDLAAIQKAAKFGHIAITGSVDAQLLDLAALLEHPRPDILHISSHGEGTGLVFEDIYGEAEAVPATRVVQLLSTYRAADGIALSGIVLNSCDSAAIADSFRAVAGVVVAHAGPLEDACAAMFAGELYATLRTVPNLAAAARIAAEHGRDACPQLPANLITLGGST